MNPMSLSTSLPGGARPAPLPFARVWQREPRLVAFALLLLLLMLPAAIGLGLDERVLRGVNVWVKPMKFMASVALLALTTAWFAALLPAAVRQGRNFRVLVWTLIATGGFEVGYITLQAALGQASHYNVGDPLHAALYTLMGGAALLMTATQPWLAWLIWRHGERRIAPAYRLGVLLGLGLTFVLGAECRHAARRRATGHGRGPAGAGLVAQHGRPARRALRRHPRRPDAAAGRLRARSLAAAHGGRRGVGGDRAVDGAVGADPVAGAVRPAAARPVGARAAVGGRRARAGC